LAAARADVGDLTVTLPDWRQVKTIFNVAVDLPARDRTAYLQEACAGDALLKDEVESLLASHENVEGFLEGTAVAEAAGHLERDLSSRWIGRRIGPYELVAELGRGGMGQVFRARRADGQYQSEVAIKLVPAAFASPAVDRRFALERQILAGLVHPGIARLLDGGTTADKVPYLVMELVEGRSIDEYCKANVPSIPARLRLFLSVCEAVSYAHRHLVVHRDLKPNNILITAEGTVKLLDFGVAKVLDSISSVGGAPPTVTLMRAFTLTFASPEQIRGEPVTTASDVYSLGVLLYHLLTGASPYRSANGSLSALSKEICEQPLSPPSAAAAARSSAAVARGSPTRIASDLDSISMLALQKDPTRRYSSVDLLAADVRRHLEHRPVLARRNAPADRVGKFIRRNRVATAASIAASLAVVAGAVLIARNERALATQSAQRLAATHRTARFLLQQLEQRSGSAVAIADLDDEQLLARLESIAARTHNDEALRRELEPVIPTARRPTALPLPAR
jgi:eukaryotic-like serine/threonine-protein kinase